MEVEEIQAQACKFPRVVGNGRTDSHKIGLKGGGGGGGEHDRDGDLKMVPGGGGNSNDLIAGVNNINRLRGWHHSSRIIRVSRASGGKDRHSKVMTSKGLRDRRVRLSVSTAIQFYDLQDRLGYDQPSKAVEWLIKAAADSIAELPPLNNPFPDTPRQLSDEKRAKGESPNQGLDSVELEIDGEGEANFQQQQNPPLSLSKSACSSNSETSKGSGLSLSRSEIRENRVKRRERARERTAKEKENDSRISINDTVNPIQQHSSFTQLLTGGDVISNQASSPTGSANHYEPVMLQKPATLDYFGTGLLGQSSSRINHSPAYQNQLGHSHLSQSMSFAGDNNHSELQHFPFVFDHFIPAAAAAATTTSQPGAVDYNLNFTISSPMAPGFNNRGTLQSNSSPSLLPHLQRFSSPLDGSSVPFFVSSAAPPLESHHQFTSGFDGRLHLYYGDANRHSDQKGKGKN